MSSNQYRTARITRSQSQDPEQDAEGSRQANNHVMSRSRAGSEESGYSMATAEVPDRGVSRRITRAGGGGPVLETVVESSLSTPIRPRPTEMLGARSGTAEVEARSDPQRSVGRLSQISGSTALTTFSEGEAQALDMDAVLESLPDLHTHASSLIETIYPQGATTPQIRRTIRAIKTPGSAGSRLLGRLERDFDAELDNYKAEAQYVKPQLVLRRIPNAAATLGEGGSSWRPDDLLFQANLADFLRRILTYEREASQTFMMLQVLDREFPSPFLSSFELPGQGQAVGSSGLISETFKLALELRTQLLIAVCKPQEDERTVRDLVDELFYDEDRQLQDWDIPFRETLGAQFHTDILKRIADVQESLGSDDDPDLETLEQDFPWSDFVRRFLDWIQLRNQEIEVNIQSNGGAVAIRDSLAAKMHPDVAPPNVALQLGSPLSSRSNRQSQPPQTPSTSGSSGIHQTLQEAPKDGDEHNRRGPRLSKGAMDLLKRQSTNARVFARKPILGITQQDIDASLTVVEQEPEGELEPMEGPERPDEQLTEVDADVVPALEVEATDDVQVEEPVGSVAQSTQSRLKQIMNYEQTVNKENLQRAQQGIDRSKARSFIDRQPNAQRVTFDNDHEILPSRASNKRRRSELSDDDPTEDEGFQQDVRSLPKRRRVSQPSSSGPPASSAPSGAIRNQIQRAATEERRVIRKPSTPPTETEPEDELPNATQLRKVTQAGKIKAAIERASRPHKRQAWSARETEQLLRLMQQVGCAWATIKEIDDEGEGLLVNRDQVALKDKARNCKIAYIKAGTRIPDYLRQVTVGKPHEDRARY